MSSWLIWIVAIISITICLFLWFRDVRRIMRERISMVESAVGQLTCFQNKAAEVVCDPELTKILMRSERIYQQAVELYHQALTRPWIRIPAYIMGFRPISSEGFVTEHNETSI